ncbi:MAG: chemotaxis protein CheW [Spirochaetaceae bacterium]|nr:chemotaxis protein CheW [Spirochaetaceae bacterium]
MSDITSINQAIAANNADLLNDQVVVVDFKMVTFALAGKDYAIDILKVKEIAKAGNFTFVPNTAPFLLGVYNLRGEIIPIIDLRIFFNIPVPARAKNKIENMVIINVNDQRFGVVVDSIDKVVGVSKNTIKPPHPIFGDINIKYIQGVVESAGRLYVLLDVDMIFASRAKSTEVAAQVKANYDVPETAKKGGLRQRANESLDLSFIGETLKAMKKLYASSVNEDWLKNRYVIWHDLRPAGNLQIQDENDAREFLDGFLSPYTGAFWSEEYMNAVYKALPENNSPVINVWNVGCGAGYETYSLAVVLKLKYPTARIRIFANDSDLLLISSASMLRFPEEHINSIYQPYLVKGVDGGYTFNQTIKEMILFEYHDCAHQNVVPDVDIVLARDVLSFLPLEEQEHLLSEFYEKLKQTGIVILGQNESMPRQSGWARFVESNIVYFTKE